MQKFKENVSLAPFTNYHIGGPARFFFEARTEDDVLWATRAAAERKIPVFILGGGTNLVVDDKGFDGLVLRVRIDTVAMKGTTMLAGAGTAIDRLTSFAARNSLAGLEWAGGLPGTLGGAIRGNAGCFGGETKEIVRSVRSLNARTGKIAVRDAAHCRFGYRDSIFKHRPEEIIIEAALHMKKGSPRDIAAALRAEKMWRNQHHPLEYPSAGSVFKNIPLSRIVSRKSAAYRTAVRERSIVHRGSTFSVKVDPEPVIAAAKLIGESGLAGARQGGALISPKHTNFIVNVGGATARDVLVLADIAKRKVKQKFGVLLEEEIQVVPKNT
jgi:UDP-N-acetylmuramate dehydrogenase